MYVFLTRSCPKPSDRSSLPAPSDNCIHTLPGSKRQGLFKKFVLKYLFPLTHQLTAFQRIHQLSILTGENGTRQVQHDADGRQQHEKGYLETGEKKKKKECPIDHTSQESVGGECTEAPSPDEVSVLIPVPTDALCQRWHTSLRRKMMQNNQVHHSKDPRTKKIRFLVSQECNITGCARRILEMN